MNEIAIVPESVRASPRPGWRDALIFVAFAALLFGVGHLFREMRVPFRAGQEAAFDLSPWRLPVYAARSVLRMFLAFGASLIFTLIYGYIAAYNKRAAKIMVPVLDILQSVPVLGFLSVTVNGFMALFPGSLLGLECASVFAIFTGQAWNMTFSFYQSLLIIPKDLQEASDVYRLNWLQRLFRLELPFSMIGLVWNSMMSFGGGWFFLAASEAISVLGHDFKLPGVGSYMAAAVEKGDRGAILWAVVTMILVVILVDQLFWRPVVAWSQRFKYEDSVADDEPTSALLDMYRRSAVAHFMDRRVYPPIVKAFNAFAQRVASPDHRTAKASSVRRFVRWGVTLALSLFGLYGAYRGVLLVATSLSPWEILRVFELGLLTLCRVAVMVVVATIIWTPIGVWIGFSPRLARIAQPLVQIAASFPANLIFPVFVSAFLYFHINMEWGCILLIALGTQWYILFNVIAGASAIPADLRRTAELYDLHGRDLWTRLILPGIFPAWVTGALTAAGGAWNASVVAEIASWGQHRLKATGLGAYVAEKTATGDWPGIILGITIMALFVVLLNRWVWRPLYALAEQRYRLG